MTALNKFIFLLLSFFLFSCDDIFEDDITDDTLSISSPQDNDVIESNVVNFQWGELEGAEKYRIQLFDQTDDQILDTLIVGKTNFVYPIAQGQYKWKARGENFAYQSNYSPIVNFSVVETLDLTNQQVLLTSPSDGVFKNTSTVNCSWQDLAAADSYDFELLNVTSGSSVFQQTGIVSPTFTINDTHLSADAKYQWRVKARNSTSETLFSSRIFFIDRITPNVPQITAPVNNSTQIINQAISFNWNAAADTGAVQSPISYTIEFSNSSTFGSLLHSSIVTTNTYQKSFTSSGDYYWRVKAVDAATNASLYSTVFKFTIN